MQSVSSWVRSWSQDSKPPEKPECMVVAESLLMELEYQINEAVMTQREKEQDQRRKLTGVDYSWLITEHPKQYEISELAKLELEELCMKVQAKECGMVINEFRKTLLQPRKPEEIARLMRAIILQVLDTRPKEDTMSEWVMRSLTKLRPLSAKITPINFEEESLEGSRNGTTEFAMTTQRSDSIDTAPQTSMDSNMTSSIEDITQPVFTRVNRFEDLPV